jgi:outer membrane protein assembly factor BamB
MRLRRFGFVVLTSALAGTLTFAQVGRGGSQWLTPFADAQRTSWVRTDDKISVATMAKPGFELQWQEKLDNRPRGVHGLAQGVSAAGVTLFVPVSIVAGSSNNVYAIDNDLGYVVWERQFDLVAPTPTAACPGGMTAAATRIVPLDVSQAAGSGRGGGGGRANPGYRSLLGEPGQGVPLEGRAGRANVSGDPGAGAGANRGRGAGDAGAARGAAPPPPPAPAARGGQADRIPGAPQSPGGGGAFGFLGRPSGVVYVVTSDGMLHVLGLPSGKDMQKPAPFLPANARWSAPVAVNTTLYAATSGNCGNAPNAVWAIDLDSEAKPVVSWKTDGGSVVGAVAFASDGTLIAAIGPGRTTGDGKANAIVALDPKTLQLRDWFTQPAAEFVTGPTILRRNNKDIVAAATKDGRVLLLDAASLGGADHATPLYASKPFVGAGATVSSEALAAWQESGAAPVPAGAGAPPAAQGPASGAHWILLPIRGRLMSGMPTTNGAVSAGAVVALRVTDAGGSLSLEPGWVSHDLPSPGTPIIVNGVVFALATGVPAIQSGRGTPAVLHAYDGATGKRFWTSGKAMGTVASPGSFWSTTGQIYVGAQDGTLYAFGFNDERRHTNGS